MACALCQLRSSKCVCAHRCASVCIGVHHAAQLDGLFPDHVSGAPYHAMHNVTHNPLVPFRVGTPLPLPCQALPTSCHAHPPGSLGQSCRRAHDVLPLCKIHVHVKTRYTPPPQLHCTRTFMPAWHTLQPSKSLNLDNSACVHTPATSLIAHIHIYTFSRTTGPLF
jgi:hypothetical protein